MTSAIYLISYLLLSSLISYPLLQVLPKCKMLQLSKFVCPIKLQLKCYIILILTGVENGLRDSMELFSVCRFFFFFIYLFFFKGTVVDNHYGKFIHDNICTQVHIYSYRQTHAYSHSFTLTYSKSYTPNTTHSPIPAHTGLLLLIAWTSYHNYYSNQ